MDERVLAVQRMQDFIQKNPHKEITLKICERKYF